MRTAMGTLGVFGLAVATCFMLWSGHEREACFPLLAAVLLVAYIIVCDDRQRDAEVERHFKRMEQEYNRNKLK